jgi:hypothetical protein
MTWGASLMRLPKGLTMAEIAEKYGADWQLPLIGSVTEIGEMIRALFPNAKHLRDDSTIEGEHAYVRFSYGGRTGDGTVDAIGVVTNGDEESIAIIRTVAQKLDLRPVDHQSGEIADLDQELQRSMAEYRAFRDRALGNSTGEFGR